MYTKRIFSPVTLMLWTRYDLLTFLGIASVPVLLHDVLDQRWIHFPWLPIALVGTSVAFILGFQNNAAYGRVWEARKIWGGIVNSSRVLGFMINDFVTNEFTSDPARLQPDFKTITAEDQVQIYEVRAVDDSNQLTNSFLSLFDHVKDNRILPKGWRKRGPGGKLTKPVAVTDTTAGYDKFFGSNIIYFHSERSRPGSRATRGYIPCCRYATGVIFQWVESNRNSTHAVTVNGQQLERR